jgi:uncharacterized protein YecT (DUF1311 family)
VRKRSKALPWQRAVLVGVGLLCAPVAAVPLAAQSAPTLDPCAGVYGQSDLNRCWAREAERSEEEMKQVYLVLLQKLPERSADGLKDAQEAWEKFREAHLRTLYGVESPSARWGREYPMCLSISRTLLNRERTEQLRRILEPDEETICPL